MKATIEQLLDTIVHPETGEGLLSGGIADRIEASGDRIAVTLRFRRARDPFSLSLKKQVQEALQARFPELSGAISVTVVEGERPRGNAPQQPSEKRSSTADIGRIVAVSSGKGGVGKSTVTANLALALRDMGYRVGILDADIYGPSQPKMFGVEGYVPTAEPDETGALERIVPAVSQGIEVMSIGFFVAPDAALMWRGPMAHNALRQMIHQTAWGPLDFLLIDMPPGTGDIHLSLLSELTLCGAIIVSTPQQVAVADVVRGVELFRHPQVQVPVTGIIENMAWFTPEELPDHRYYLFGRGGAERYATENGLPFLGPVPLIQSVMEGSEAGCPAVVHDARAASWYRQIAERVVDNLAGKC